MAPDGSTGSMYDYLTVGAETGITGGSTYVIRNRYSGRYVALASQTDTDKYQVIY